MAKRLYHFSEDDGIARFEPRRVTVSARRPLGQEWLNGPLVWAIEAAFSPLYLFPRQCPRIVMWRLPNSDPADAARYWTDPAKRMVAFIEHRWMERLQAVALTRYQLPPDPFIDLHDAGMHVCKSPVSPISKTVLTNVPALLDDEGVELRICASLVHLKNAWNSSLHVSGIRLRNAEGWDQ